MNPNFAPWGQQQPAPVPQSQGATPWNTQPQPTQPPFGQPQSNGFGGAMNTGFAGSTPSPTGPPISLDPESFTTGGMIDNVIVSFSDSRVVMFDYNGKSQSGAVPAIHSVLTILDAATGQPLHGSTPQPKYWTLGKASEFGPSADGFQIVPLSSKKGLNESSNGAILVKSLIAAGFPRNVIAAGNVKCLDGLVALVQNKTRPKNPNDPPAAPGEKDNATLCVSQIHRFPAGVQGGAPVVQPQPVAQPQPQPPAPQQFMQPAPAFAPPPQVAPLSMQPGPGGVPGATGPNMEAAAAMLRDIATAHPTTRAQFNVLVFQKAMQAGMGADEATKGIMSNPQFQQAVLGNPLTLQ